MTSANIQKANPRECSPLILAKDLQSAFVGKYFRRYEERIKFVESTMPQLQIRALGLGNGRDPLESGGKSKSDACLSKLQSKRLAPGLSKTNLNKKSSACERRMIFLP